MRPTSLALLAALAGCAPIHSNVNVAGAEVALEGARAAGAQKSAPYEYTAAEAHLRKAREEMGWARYGAAAELAERARQLAEEAKAKASGAPRPDGQGVAAPVTPKPEAR